MDISRQTIIVMVKRNGFIVVPKDDPVLLEGERAVMYAQERISNSTVIRI